MPQGQAPLYILDIHVHVHAYIYMYMTMSQQICAPDVSLENDVKQSDFYKCAGKNASAAAVKTHKKGKYNVS